MPARLAEPTDDRELTPEEFTRLISQPVEEDRELSPREFTALIEPHFPRESGTLEAIGSSAMEGLATVPELGGIASRKLSKAMGLPEESPFFDEWAGGLRGAAQLLDPVENRGQGGLSEDVARGVGSLIGSAPSLALGPVAKTIQFGAQQGVPMYFDVKEATGDEKAATKALLFGSLAGQLEHLGAEKVLGGIVEKLSKKGVQEAVEGIVMTAALKGVAKGAIGEVVPEVSQQALEDIVYESLTDEDRNILEDMRRSVGPAAILGGGVVALDLAIQRAHARRTGRAKPQQPTDTPEALLAPEEAPEGPAGEAESLLPTEAPAEATLAPQPESGASLVEREGEAGVGAMAVEEAAPSSAQAAPPPLEEADVTPEQLEADLPPEAEPAGEPSKATGIKNRTVAKELERMGLEAPEGSARVPWEQRHAEAKETLKKDPEAGAKLVEELADSPRNPSDKEYAVLTFEANRRIVEREAAQDAFNENPTPANEARIERAQERYEALADVLKKTGEESGRALAIRKMMIARDYSLAAMERGMREAKGGEPLTTEERAKLKEMHADIAKKTAALEKHLEETELKRAELAAENAMLKLKAEAKRAPARAARKKAVDEAKAEAEEIWKRLDAKSRRAHVGLPVDMVADLAKLAGVYIKIGKRSFEAWASDVVSRLGDAVRPHLRAIWDTAVREDRKRRSSVVAERVKKGEKLTDQSKFINDIAKEFVAEGITDRATLVGKVHDVLREIDPEITLRETSEAFSGHGRFRELTKDEAKRKLADLRAETRALLKLEDIEAKRTPPKTGAERRPQTIEEKRLYKQAKRRAEELGIPLKDPAESLASRIKARKTRLANAIEDIEARIERGDFSPKKKPEPLPEDEESLRLKAEKIAAERRLAVEKEKKRKENLTTVQKAYEIYKGVMDLPRNVKSAFDLSAIRRQGGFWTLASPRASGKLFRPMLESVRSQAGYDKAMAAIAAHPRFNLATASGVEFTGLDEGGPIEEGIKSRWSDKFPGVNASNRAYTAFLSAQRMMAFDALVEAMPHNPGKAELEAIADFVNITTGRASGRGKGVAKAIEGTKFMWAPSFAVSRFQVVGRPLTAMVDKRLTFAAKRQIAKSYAKYGMGLSVYYGMIGGLLYAAGKAIGKEVSIGTDPRDSEFGKIRIGNTRIDPLSGFAQAGVLISRMISGEKKSKGKLRKLDGKGRGDASRYDVLERFLANKASPVPGAVISYLKGVTPDYKPATPRNLAIQVAPFPLTFVDAYEAMKDLGIPTGVAVSILGAAGDSIQVYEEETKKGRK